MTPKALAEIAGSRYFPRKDTDKFSGSLLKFAHAIKTNLVLVGFIRR